MYTVRVFGGSARKRKWAHASCAPRSTATAGPLRVALTLALATTPSGGVGNVIGWSTLKIVRLRLSTTAAVSVYGPGSGRCSARAILYAPAGAVREPDVTTTFPDGARSVIATRAAALTVPVTCSAPFPTRFHTRSE